MMLISPQTVYENLQLLEKVDEPTSASFRQLAQEALSDPDVSETWQKAIADRLNQANVLLGMKAIGNKDDSY